MDDGFAALGQLHAGVLRIVHSEAPGVCMCVYVCVHVRAHACTVCGCARIHIEKGTSPATGSPNKAFPVLPSSLLLFTPQKASLAAASLTAAQEPSSH